MRSISTRILFSVSFFSLLTSQADASMVLLGEEPIYPQSFSCVPAQHSIPSNVELRENDGEIDLSLANRSKALTMIELKTVLRTEGSTATSLDIAGNTLGDNALKVIFSFPNFQSLYFEENCFTDKGAYYLQAFKNIREINLSRNSISYEGVTFLPLTYLEVLQVNSITLGYKGLEYLSAALRLYHLNSCNAQLDDQSAPLLTKIPTLKILDLAYNSFTDESVKEFGKMKGLEVLNISHNKFTHEAIRELKEMLPKTKIITELSKS